MTCTNMDGFVPIPNWWLSHPNINSNRLSVLMALARYADRSTHTCFPSQSTIAKLLDASRAWVNKIIKELVEIGLVQKTYRTRSNNGNTSCMYKVFFDAPCGEGQEGKAGHNSLSQGVTGGVKESDTNNNKDKYILSTRDSDDPKDWEVSADAVAEMSKLAPSLDVRKYAKKFREKVLARGYQYSNLNQAVLDWFKADLDRGILKNRKGKEKNSKRFSLCTTVTSPKPAPMSIDACPADMSSEERVAVETILAKGTIPAASSNGARFLAAMVRMGQDRGLATYQSWFKKLRFAGLTDGELNITGGNSFEMSHIISRYGDDILNCCASVGIRATRVKPASK